MEKEIKEFGEKFKELFERDASDNWDRKKLSKFLYEIMKNCDKETLEELDN